MMLTPIREGTMKRSTPDPADDLMMVGHLFVRDAGVVLVDPPHVPGLIECTSRLGKLEKGRNARVSPPSLSRKRWNHGGPRG